MTDKTSKGGLDIGWRLAALTIHQKTVPWSKSGAAKWLASDAPLSLTQFGPLVVQSFPAAIVQRYLTVRKWRCLHINLHTRREESSLKVDLFREKIRCGDLIVLSFCIL